MNYLINSSTDPYFNMAFDEYCLEQYPSNAPFFYLWRNSPAVIIGLNQNAYSEVNLDYLEKNGLENPYKATSAVIICECKNVTDQMIESLVREDKVKSVEDLKALTGAGSGCGKCVGKLKEAIEEAMHILGKSN